MGVMWIACSRCVLEGEQRLYSAKKKIHAMCTALPLSRGVMLQIKIEGALDAEGPLVEGEMQRQWMLRMG